MLNLYAYIRASGYRRFSLHHVLGNLRGCSLAPCDEGILDTPAPNRSLLVGVVNLGQRMEDSTQLTQAVFQCIRLEIPPTAAG